MNPPRTKRSAIKGVRVGRAKAAYPAKFYDKAYRTLSKYALEWHECPYAPLWRCMVGFLPPPVRPESDTATTILDIGCGPGQFAEFLRSHGFADYIGVDFSRVAIDMAKKRFYEDQRFYFSLCDVTSPDFTNTHGFYDAVVTTETLEHLDDDVGLLAKLNPVPIVATVPMIDSKSHVRYFTEAEGVLARYGGVITGLSVVQIVLNTHQKFFLLSGVLRGW